MIYRGSKISDEVWHTRYEDWGKFCSNDFDLDADSFKLFLTDLGKKAKELTERGIEFKNLRINFYATEYRENDYGPDDEAGCGVSYAYDTRESDEEKADRIARAKRNIDRQIADEERKKASDAASKEREINKAITFLTSNGYTVKI